MAVKEHALSCFVHNVDSSVTLESSLVDETDQGGCYVLLYQFHLPQHPHAVSTFLSRTGELVEKLSTVHGIRSKDNITLANLAQSGLVPRAGSVCDETLNKCMELERAWLSLEALDIPPGCDHPVRTLLDRLAAYNEVELPMFSDHHWRSLVHGDIHPWNIFLGDDDNLYLCDWEYAKIGYPEQDLGTILNWLDPEMGMTLVSCYAQRNGLPEDELAARCDYYATNLLILRTAYYMLLAIHSKNGEKAKDYYNEFNLTARRFRRLAPFTHSLPVCI